MVLGNLSCENDELCDTISNTNIPNICAEFIIKLENLNESFWLIGNLAIGSQSAKQKLLDKGFVWILIQYLQGDYEKPDEIIKTCLWTI